MRDQGKELSDLVAELAAEASRIARDSASLKQKMEMLVRVTQRRDGQDGATKTCLGKRSYRTADAAGQAAQHAKRARDVAYLRVYDCQLCGGYHLTSVPLANVVGAD